MHSHVQFVVKTSLWNQNNMFLFQRLNFSVISWLERQLNLKPLVNFIGVIRKPLLVVQSPILKTLKHTPSHLKVSNLDVMSWIRLLMFWCPAWKTNFQLGRQLWEGVNPGYKTRILNKNQEITNKFLEQLRFKV